MTRKIVSRNPHREVGIVNAGWLLNHSVEHESHLERRFIIAALACPVVTDIIHQPVTLILNNNGKEQRYTPDFELTLIDGNSVIVEVKPKIFVQKHVDKLNLAKKEFESCGKKFEIITDEMIDGNALASRALLLMRYGRLRYTDEMAIECLEAIKIACEGSATVKDLVEKGISEALIWNLVARHKCRVPADFSLDLSQSVSINKIEGDSYVYFRSWFGTSER